jgi:hypothetical protein
VVATGEAIAHLKYLEKPEMIRKEKQRQKILLSIKMDHDA